MLDLKMSQLASIVLVMGSADSTNNSFSGADPAVAEAEAALDVVFERARLAAGFVAVAESELVSVTQQVLAHVDDHGVGWGFRSEGHQLGFELGLTRRQASVLVKVARRLPELKLVEAAFAAGEINLAVAGIICEVATADNQQYLVELSKTATVAQLQKICSTYKAVKPKPKREPFLSLTQSEDEQWDINGCLGPVDGAVFEKALAAKRDELFHTNQEPASNAEALMGSAPFNALC